MLFFLVIGAPSLLPQLSYVRGILNSSQERSKSTMGQTDHINIELIKILPWHLYQSMSKSQLPVVKKSSLLMPLDYCQSESLIMAYAMMSKNCATVIFVIMVAFYSD